MVSFKLHFHSSLPSTIARSLINMDERLCLHLLAVEVAETVNVVSHSDSRFPGKSSL